MSGAHAKPLTRRQLRQRNRIGKWTAGVMSLLLLGGATMCALTMPGTPTALGVPDRSPTPAVTRSVDGPTVSRTSTREALADGVEAVSVDSTGTWTMGNDRIDVERLTRAAPEPTDLHHAKATEQTVDLLNDTDIPADTTTSTPAATGDSGNAYPWGQCTWWAYVRRHQLGLPVGSYFGNGQAWASSAARLGYSVDATPTVGAIIVFAPGQAGADLTYGHVAIVEQVHADGSITISESNAQGLGVISNRTLANSNQYTYIH